MHQVFQHIFTSPSSVQDFNNDDSDSPPSKKQKSSKKSHKSDVAHLQGMNRVMPHAIAYCAILLHFNLTDAKAWPQDSMYLGLSYHDLYNFIVDYFEQDATEAKDKKRVHDLLDWWNRCNTIY
ncbi:hypothetical protein FISHEDRAFT_69628 [Fistulina hepatica ATCC 64428]|uniref:Uncharacterized protein n=1 Tax=Fistulina hepatica ATCC 64428 TaxID=1128425 RepID=A0A0D7ALS8_9AGAR|nr:hypothetical protein FISHEDRAFT_69628 [Fistulina hepatica ATCC 64428]